MVIEDIDLTKRLFKDLDYKNHIDQYPIDKVLKIEISKANINKKHKEKYTITKSNIYKTVDPNNNEPIPVEIDDLIRLHFLVISRKVTTILEFGVGRSNPVFDHALEINKSHYSDFVKNNLRRSNAFECHAVDNYQKWIDHTKETYPNTKNVIYNFSKTSISTFNSRICTFYENLPNICPDLIYLDAPDQFSSSGDINGISTNHPDRMPMSGDILRIENFLLPGTLVVIDGRTANARFLKNNLQRDWYYHHSFEYDQHFFELRETPLGRFNKNQIEFCLGSEWINSLD
jgi:hypothetical protein